MAKLSGLDRVLIPTRRLRRRRRWAAAARVVAALLIGCGVALAAWAGR